MAGIDFIHQNGVDYEIVPEIAPRFKTTVNYAAGDCVIYNAEAYRFKTAHLAGAWIGTDAEKFLVGEELGAIKEDLSEVNSILANDTDLLINSLSDKTATSLGVTYTLSGNVVTISGTASATYSSFTIFGGVNAPPPNWLSPGRKYVVAIENATPAAMRMQSKASSESSINNFAILQKSGYYIVTVPSDMVFFRIMLTMEKNEVANGTFKVEIFEIENDVIKDNCSEMSAEIDDIKNDYFELTTDNCPMIPDNSDLNTYTAAGTYKITNNTHAATMINMPEPAPGKLVVIATTQASRLTQMYYPVNGSEFIFIRTYNTGGWGNWRSLINSGRYNTPVLIGNYAIDTGDTTEKMSIYLPAKDGYIRYEMRHFVNDTKNCNGWQIYHAYHLSTLFTNEIDLTISGEWECALRLDGRDDFSGGITHGDEIMESITCLVDGVPTTISGLTARKNAKEVRIIQTSILYDPTDHTTQIAKHGKEYVFTKDGLTIEQSVKWLVSETLGNCFLAMFLPSKNYIDRATANSDFEVLELASNTSETQDTIVKQKANAVNMWDTGSGFSANISTPIYPTGLSGGDQISIGDNNGNPYNKLYFKVCGGGSSSVGELWKSKSIYKLDFSE